MGWERGSPGESCPGWRSDEVLPVEAGIRSQAGGKPFHKNIYIYLDLCVCVVWDSEKLRVGAKGDSRRHVIIP